MTIFWLCPRPETASGGVSVIHRLSRLCNEMGKASSVWQTAPFSVWWDAEGPFDDQLCSITEDWEPGDTVIVPEVLLPTIDVTTMETQRVICFIQNHLWAPKNQSTYDGVEIITVSRYLDNWCRRVLGKKPTGLVSPYISQPWRVTHKTTDRTLVIARRNPELAWNTASLLETEGFAVHYLDHDVTQSELSTILDECEFYVHLSHPEGIPWACVEAMASGVIPIGTTGGGGNEFMFHKQTAMVVQDPHNGRYPDGDEFMHRILEEMKVLRADNDLRSSMWQNGHNWVRLRYSKERTIRQLGAILS